MRSQPDRQLIEATLGAGALAERPHLFSDSRVTLPQATVDQLAAFVRDVTALIAQPAYQQAVAERQAMATTVMPPGVCLA